MTMVTACIALGNSCMQGKVINACMHKLKIAYVSPSYIATSAIISDENHHHGHIATHVASYFF